MAHPTPCALCRRPLPAHGHYVVRIDVFADPSMPPLTQDQIDALDLGGAMEQLIQEMQHLSADDLQDQVHRRFEFRICPACQPRFLANPLGLPRDRSILHPS